LILKSRYVLVFHRDWIDGRIRDYAQRFGIRIFRYALCGDHIHFAVEIPHASYYKKFIRALTGVIARKIGTGIWSLLPFTRIANWGADFRNLIAYIQKNDEETRILRRYEPRKRAGKPRNCEPPATLPPCFWPA
jgi:REP element-mobilizing transposase RayT